MSVGKLLIFLGAMFSGKTTIALHLLQTLGRVNKNLYINSAKDTRTKEPFSSHNIFISAEQVKELNATMLKVKRLSEISDEIILKHDKIIIDEGQFFSATTDDINRGDIESIIRWVDELHKTIYVLGLSGDSNRKPFGRILELIPYADDVKMLRDTPCDFCAEIGIENTSLFSYRQRDLTGQQEQIGSNEYRAACRKCFNTKENKNKKL